MGNDRHEKVSDLFARARRLEPDDRESFLDDACGNDTALRDDLRSLFDPALEEALPTQAVRARIVAVGDHAAPLSDDELTPGEPGRRRVIGAYEIIR
ncbi:MAG: hypothetical protein KC983_03375, partial [Phycisphaerales bacterium]|nr:hypothetical protein [Phycisphaerales bacterium]